MKSSINSILISGGTVWDGEQFIKSDVLINNGIISQIDNCITTNADVQFNAENMIVSAGLIDFHTHIMGISHDSIGIDAEKISYPFGVTSLVDASAEQNNCFSKLNKDINVLAMTEIVNNKADFEITKKIISKYGDRVIGLKVYFDNSFVDVWDTKPLKEICDFASKNSLFVMVHTTNSPVRMSEIVDILNSGDIISHAFHGGENNAAQDDFIALKKAGEKGIYTDAALCAYYHIDYSVFKKSLDYNICPNIISTDITKDLELVDGKKYGLPICMSILEKIGLGKTDVFKAVTVNPAKLLKNKKNKGYLKVGDPADISVFKYESDEVSFEDRFNNKLELNSYLKCVLTILNNEIMYFES